MNRVVVWGATILAIILGGFIGKAVVGKLFGRGSPENELPRMVEAVKSKAGTKVDEVTRLDSARHGPGKRLVYEFTILNVETPKDLDPGVDLATVKQKIRTQACAIKGIQTILNHEIDVLYEYKAVNGEYLMDVDLTKAKCGL
ncbi:hypothetical protein [Usitatibacter palustris]|uniref:Uncharacterized protein n=1 Tax=Usitatibacter palustris TaxID=2732487 RepID=A0A6M4H7J6_9PROT|nr:hypothetical protein [Usitatibacter palustris]QJR15342.1 hypothetical protein DSM104440_02161 [Usitatibacter palustris]